MYSYAWYHWITFFFIYCFLGWCFESAYVSLRKRHFVNRGFLRLPMLPLYGTGALMMLWLSLPVKGNIYLVYLSGVVGATVLEYITGYFMELLFKVRYWDYSKKICNLHGYVCLGSSLAWGFLTILMTDVIHTPIAEAVVSVPFYVEITFITTIGVLFTADTIWSAKEAFDLARALESMTRMKGELEAIQVQMSLLKMEIAQRVGQIIDDYPVLPDVLPATQAKLSELKNQTLQKASELKNEIKNETEAALTNRIETLTQSLESISRKRESITKQMSFYRKGLFRGNPSATSRRFAEAMKELKEFYSKR